MWRTVVGRKKIDKKAYIGVLTEIKSNDSIFYRILYTSVFFLPFL